MTIDQAPALALDLLGDADNWPPRRLPPSHSIGIMTEEGSWPEFPGYDPTIATTSRVMWRSPQAAPGGGALWDEPGRYGTIPEWQPAKASDWIVPAALNVPPLVAAMTTAGASSLLATFLEDSPNHDQMPQELEMHTIVEWLRSLL